MSLLTGLLSGCFGNNVNSFDYSALYKKDVTKYEEDVGENTSSSYGFLGNEIQGYNSWYYLAKTKNNSLEQMSFENDRFSFNNAYLFREEVQSTKEVSAVRRYVSKVKKKALIYGNVKHLQGAGNLEIYINESQKDVININENDYNYFEFETDLNINDKIDFLIKGDVKVKFDPSIMTDESNLSLYHKNALNKSYGDVFPYYDEVEKQLYMYYLYTDNAMNGKYYTNIEIAKDCLTFKSYEEENNYKIWNNYKQNGNLSLVRDSSRYIELDKYDFGIRDHHLVFDKENKRYILIAGCYYRFDGTKQTSDLVIYTSDDELGFSWTKKGNVIASYDRNLPECPGVMKINNRWYAFVSVAYVTAHQVGPLQYWMGEEGQDISDINFKNKSFEFLDGEDLCAARVFNILDKTYMYGWIPNTYDTMPWSPWGGYLNLPREVIQMKDGRLGGRLDDGLKKILNYGNILSVEKAKTINDEYKVGSKLKRNYITYGFYMNNANEVSYVFKQGANTFKASVIKENNEYYMQVSSPNDSKHKLNSKNKIQNNYNNKFNITIVNDGEFIEFFVNNEFALTAHTSMKNDFYEGYLYSDSEVSYSNISINKLVPYWNLY